jgi:hypothetical protein
MPTYEELKILAETRFQEAKILSDNNFIDGGRYLLGYVVEFALKARICKILDIDEYPETGEISKVFKTHGYDVLIKLAGLEKEFDKATNSSKQLFDNWSTSTKWSEDFRYKPIGTNKKKDFKDAIDALDDQKDGVFIWIKKWW